MADVVLLAGAGWLMFPSPVLTMAVCMPYLALRLGQWQRTRTRLYNVLLVLLVAYGLGMITWYLSTKPTNLFEAIGVVPDVTTSLPLRIQMNKLLAKGGKVPDELLRAAKALVNDDQRRRYIMHGPNMEMDFTGLVAWNLECLLFLCSLASSKHGGEGTSMLVLGMMLLFLGTGVELVEKHSPMPGIKINALPLLCTFELTQVVRLLLVSLYSLCLFQTSSCTVDRSREVPDALDRIIQENAHLLLLVVEQGDKNKDD